MLRNQNTVKYSKVLVRFFLIFKHCIYGFHFAEIFANAKIIDTMKKVKVFSKIFFLKEDVWYSFSTPFIFIIQTRRGPIVHEGNYLYVKVQDLII